MEEQSPSVAKAISPTRSDDVGGEARTLQRRHSVVCGVVVDRVRSYFCSPVGDEIRGNGVRGQFRKSDRWASPIFFGPGTPGRTWGTRPGVKVLCGLGGSHIPYAGLGIPAENPEHD